MNPAALYWPCYQILTNANAAPEILFQLLKSRVIQKILEDSRLKDFPSLDTYLKPFKDVYDIWNSVAGSNGGIISKGKGQLSFDTQGFRNAVNKEPETEDPSYSDKRDSLVSSLKEFIHNGLEAEDNEGNLNAIQEFSFLLSKADDIFWEEVGTDNLPVCTTEEKAYILALQEKISQHFLAAKIPGSCLVTSTVASLLLPALNDHETPQKVFDSFSNFLQETEAELAHPSEASKVGNAFQFNENTQYLIANGKHQNIFKAVSSLLFRCENAAEIIQATCYNMMLQNSQLESETVSWSAGNYSAADVKLNVLGENYLPYRFTIENLSRLLKRDIVVHLGNSEGSNTSLLFGYFHDRTPINILILGDAQVPEIYSLVPVHTQEQSLKNGNILMGRQIACESLWNWNCDPEKIDFKEFGSEMKTYFQKCHFCVDFDRELCRHITDLHFNANLDMMSRMVDKKYGNFSAADIEIKDIDEAVMKDESSVADKFVIIKTEGDNHCMFHSVSYCMTKQFALTLPLRRAVAVEFRENEKLYTQSLLDANVPPVEIENIRNRLHSFTDWGNENSLAILSRIVGRKIILFGSNDVQCREPLDWHVTYNISKHMSQHYPPIFLLLRKNHFHALIPKKDPMSFVPRGRDKQFKTTQTAIDNFVVFTDHNYDSNFQNQSKRGPLTYSLSERYKSSYNEIKVPEEVNMPMHSRPCSSTEIKVLEQEPLCSSSATTVFDNDLEDVNVARDKQQSAEIEFNGPGQILMSMPGIPHTCTANVVQKIKEEVMNEASNEIESMEKDDIVQLLEGPESQLVNLNEPLESNAELCPTHLTMKSNGVTFDIDVEGFNENILEETGMLQNFSQKDKELYTIYLNAIKLDVAKLQSLRFQEQNIRIFMQRSLFVSFWKSNLLRGQPWYNGSAMKKKKWQNKAKQLLKVQENAEGRNLTKQFLLQANISTQACDLYTAMMEKIVKEHSDRNSTSTKLKNEVMRLISAPVLKSGKEIRSCPEYNHAGLEYSKSLDKDVFTAVSPMAISIHHPASIQHSSLHETPVTNMPSEKADLTSVEFLDKQSYFFNQDINVATTFVISTMLEKLHFPLDKGNEKNISELERNFSPGSDTFAAVGNDDDVNMEDITPRVSDRLSFDTARQNDKALNNHTINEGLSSCFSDTSESVELEDDKHVSDSAEEDLEENQGSHRQFLARSMNIPEDVLNYIPPKDFEIALTRKDLLNCFNFKNNVFEGGKWADIISSKVTEVQKVCSFNAEGSPDYYKNPMNGFCRMRGHCGGKCELKFVIKIMEPPKADSDLKCQVKSEGRFTLIQLEPTSRRLMGERRKEMSRLLVDNMPIKILIQNMSKATFLRHLHVNQDQFSLAALQQLRYETVHSNDMFRDLSNELKKIADKTERSENQAKVVKGFLHLRNEEEGNIQIHMYTEMALNFLIASNEKPGSIIYCDATGSVCNNVNNKRVLFYLALLETPEGEIAPIASSIAHRGRAIDIADLFIKVKSHVKLLQPSYNKPLAPVICVDFSMAMIQGLLQGVNTMEIRDYIKHTYDVIADKTTFDKKRSVIFICSSHLVKSFSRLLGKHIPNSKELKPLKSLGIHSLARLQACNDMESYKKTVTCIVETFGMEFISEDVVQRNRELLLSKENLIDELQQSDFDLGGHEIEDFNDHKLLRECSMFYHIFREIRSKTEASSTSLSTKNPFYLPIVLDTMQNFYIPYFGLWSSSIMYKTERHFQGSLTNGQIEAEFNIIKNHLLKGRRLPLTNYIEQHYEYFTGRLYSVFGPASQLRQRLYKRDKRREQRYENSHRKPVPDEDKEEEWQRKLAALERNVYVGRNVFDFEKKESLATDSCQDTHSSNTFPVPSISLDQDEDEISQDPLNSLEFELFGNLNSSNIFEEKEVIEALDECKLEEIEDIFAKISVDSTSGLSSKQLADICNVHYWIETEEMEFMMKFVKSRSPLTDYIISNQFYAWKQLAFDEKTNRNVYKWRSTKDYGIERPDEHPVDECDPVNYKKILHPLIVHNHWCLLDINKETKTCTLYDSLYRSDNLLDEVQNEVIKYFVHPSEDLTSWVFTHGKREVSQVDSSMCGLHVYEISKLIMSGNDITWNNLRHLNNNKKARLRVVRELLGSTKFGEHILREVKDDDIRLERVLHDIHYDCQNAITNLSEERLCKVNKQEDDQVIQKTLPASPVVSQHEPSSQVNTRTAQNSSLQEQMSQIQFEDILSDPSTGPAAISILQEQLGLRSKANLQVTKNGKQNVKELLRRANATEDKAKPKKSSCNPDSEDFVFDESLLDKWDEICDDTKCLKSKLVPQFAQKKKLLDLHYCTARKLDRNAITSLCMDMFSELKDIRDGKLFSKRHEMFLKAGKSKLFGSLIIEPFTDVQDSMITEMIEKQIRSISDNVFDGRNQDYIIYVLKPELFTRLYAKCNDISNEHARKELSFGASYESKLPPTLLKKIES